MARRPYILSQFLRLLTRYQFRLIAKKYKGDYRSKHFKCWDQLACMIFAHNRQESSQRDIDRALNSHSAKLYHIGIQQCPKSTLADANEHRDYRIYEEFAKSMMLRPTANMQVLNCPSTTWTTRCAPWMHPSFT